MTDIDDIRGRMHALTEQARRTICACHDTGAVGGAECLALAREMQGKIIMLIPFAPGRG